MKHKSKLIVMVAGIIGLLGYLVWSLWPVSLTAHARRLLLGAIANDPNAVFSYSAEHERAETGLTEGQFVRVWKELVSPKLGDLRIDGPIELQINPPGHQALAFVRVKDSWGSSWELEVDCWQGDERPESVVMKFLLIAWRVDYARRAKKTPEQVTPFVAYAEGLRKDRQTLESIGLNGISNNVPSSHLATWAELDSWWSSGGQR